MLLKEEFLITKNKLHVHVFVTENEKIPRLVFFRYIIMKTRKKKTNILYIIIIYNNAFFRYKIMKTQKKNIINKLINVFFLLS